MKTRKTKTMTETDRRNEMADTMQSTETTRLFKNLDRPSLHVLSYALRHPDTWPQGFVWDFDDCMQCGMGLAHLLWANSQIGDTAIGDDTEYKEWISIMARQFSMPYGKAHEIFFGGAYREPRYFGLSSTEIPRDRVTPEMVADQIDKYLATAE